MLNIEQAIDNKFSAFENSRPWLKKPAVGFLKRLMHEAEVNQFLKEHEDDEGFDFIDEVFKFFNFGYSISNIDRSNIPASGRVILVANHPLGALDGLALLKLVGEVRRDVKIVVNDMLMDFKAVNKLLLPVDNLNKTTQKSSITAILHSLNNDEAVIIFPAGEVSRIRPNGVMDGKCSTGFLSFAKKAQAPILPVHIKARNSPLFYSSSMLYKPLSSILLAHEIFNKTSTTINVTIGGVVPYRVVENLPMERKEVARIFRRRAYLLGKGKSGLFETEKTIIHPRDRKSLKSELSSAELLGETTDGKKIYLFDYQSDSAVMNEIGRLREITFRQVGEGTGNNRDLDKYDKYYRHIVLWDEQELEIVGSYRLAEVKRLMDIDGGRGIYSQTLFNYDLDNVSPYFEQGLELGRSFVSPKYWGKRSLDLLWYGIGAYLRKYPTARYLFGPVSLSDAYPDLAKALIVGYYRHYFPDHERLASAKVPYIVQQDLEKQVAEVLTGQDKEADFKLMKAHLAHMNLTVPTLYKQYADLCEDGGVRFVDFNIDADFGHCVDGLIMTDMHQLKQKKCLRYIGDSWYSGIKYQCL